MSLQILAPGLPNLLVLSMRWLAHWSGAWSADIVMKDIAVPSGKIQVVDTDNPTLLFTGTVDAQRTGTFGEKQHVRIVGGGGGWGSPVRSQHFHNDLGVNLLELAQATAVEAGEIVNVIAPVLLKTDFIRREGAAAQIFADSGVDWWVDTFGITQVGIRPPAVAPTTLLVEDWNPAAGTVSFSSPDLVLPGMTVIDTRFGTMVVTSVDAEIRDGAIHGTLWLASSPPSPGSSTHELLDSLAALASDATGSDYGKWYEYRVIAMQGTRATLQAVNPTKGMPDLIPVSIWAGVSGAKMTLKPGSRCLVGFTASKQPYVAAYEPPEGNNWRPLTLELDATVSLLIGALAPSIVLGAGGQPIALAPAVIAFANALNTAITAMGSAATATGPAPVTGATLGGFITPLVTALTTAIVTLTTACPSLKVQSS